jgi:hypothetical protein
VGDGDALEKVLRPRQETRLRQAAAGPGEQVGRRSPFLDQHDLLALVLVEAAGELHVDKTGLNAQLGELGSQEIIEWPDVLSRDASSQDADDHAASILGGRTSGLQRGRATTLQIPRSP